MGRWLKCLWLKESSCSPNLVLGNRSRNRTEQKRTGQDRTTGLDWTGRDWQEQAQKAVKLRLCNGVPHCRESLHGSSARLHLLKILETFREVGFVSVVSESDETGLEPSHLSRSSGEEGGRQGLRPESEEEGLRDTEVQWKKKVRRRQPTQLVSSTRSS